MPRLLAMLCILAVFLPSFFMEGAARACSCRCRWRSASPWWLATCCRARSCRCCRSGCCGTTISRTSTRRRAGSRSPGFAARLRASCCGASCRCRWIVVPAYLVVAGAADLAGRRAAGHGDLSHGRRRPVPASRCGPDRHAHRSHRGDWPCRRWTSSSDEVGPDNVAISVGYVGLIPSSYPINTVYLWTERPGGGGPARRPEAGQRRPHRGAQGAAARRSCRHAWRTGCANGCGARRLPADADRRSACAALQLSFEPADIVNEVMSFGSPTPVEVAVSGPNLADNRAYAEKVHAQLAKIPSLRDLQFGQSLDYPTVEVKVDRERAGAERRDDGGRGRLAGGGHLVQPLHRAQLLAPIPKTGIGYQVQVEMPHAADELGHGSGPGAGQAARTRASCCCATWPDVHEGTDARRIRPLQHAAHGEHDGQHRGRGPGPGGRPDRRGRSRPPASRRAA